MADGISAHRLFAAYHAPGGNVVALQGLSIDVPEREFLAIVGPSGSGKSTLLRCLAARQRPLAGDLHAFGVALHDAGARELARYRAQTVAFVQQRYVTALSPDLPLWRIVAQRPALAGWSGKAARQRALELLERIGLDDRPSARRIDLSGGEQQRVAVAAALAVRPSLLLADEVTGELDDRSGREVLALIRELAAGEGSTVVLVTHDAKALRVADRTVTIRDGRVTGELATGGAGARIAVDEGGVLRLDPVDLAAAGIQGDARLDVGPGRLTLFGSAAASRSGPPRPASEPPLPRDAQEQVVEVDRVVRRYGSREPPPVDGVSFELRRGRLHVVAGPSGCGKTTLVHLVGGLERPDEGRVSVLGADLSPLSRSAVAAFRRAHIAIVPQSATLVPFLTAEENIELALAARGIPAADARLRAREALDQVALDGLSRRRAGELSAGQRQRVAVARAIAARPDVLLADEPTANLDELNAVLVSRLLADCARRYAMAVLCATHDRSVEEQADDVLRLRGPS